MMCITYINVSLDSLIISLCLKQIPLYYSENTGNQHLNVIHILDTFKCIISSKHHNFVKCYMKSNKTNNFPYVMQMLNSRTGLGTLYSLNSFKATSYHSQQCSCVRPVSLTPPLSHDHPAPPPHTNMDTKGYFYSEAL